MLDIIERLLILQDRDRNLHRIRAELANLDPERRSLKTKETEAVTRLEAAKQRGRQIETARKSLELDVESKAKLIERYANQQLQTRKNEEYKALAHEIEMCKADIAKIEDQQLELMEQAEAVQREVAERSRIAEAARKLAAEQLAAVSQREANLKQELADLGDNREELAGAVPAAVRDRYERLFKSKGENVVVGVNHGVCGGCHMKLPAQILVGCRAQQEVITCTNCGRILYYSREMNLAVAE